MMLSRNGVRVGIEYDWDNHKKPCLVVGNEFCAFEVAVFRNKDTAKEFEARMKVFFDGLLKEREDG